MIKRYSIYQGPDDYRAEMKEDPQGEYVRFEDFARSSDLAGRRLVQADTHKFAPDPWDVSVCYICQKPHSSPTEALQPVSPDKEVK